MGHYELKKMNLQYLQKLIDLCGNGNEDYSAYGGPNDIISFAVCGGKSCQEILKAVSLS
jgi:hypothetical protein